MQMSSNHVPAAAGLLLLAMALIAFVDNFVRLIAEDAGLWQFLAVRSAMALPLLWGVARWRGWSLRPVRWRAVIQRSVLMATALTLYFAAVAVVPIAIAGAGLYTSPIFVLLISIVLFGVRIGVWRAAAVALGFAGVLLVLQPGSAAFSPLTLLPVLAGALYAAGALTTRRLCMGESPACLVFGFFLVMAVYGSLGLAVLALVGAGGAPGEASFFGTGWQEVTPRFLWLCLMQAILSLVAVGCLVRAYQIADPSYVSVFEYSFLPFAGVWGYLLWSEVPGPVAILGIGCILVAGCAIILRGRKVAA